MDNRNDLNICKSKAIYKAICTVTINADDAMLNEINPNLSDRMAIRFRVQKSIDLSIQQKELEDTETISIEDARVITIAVEGMEYARSGIMLLGIFVQRK